MTAAQKCVICDSLVSYCEKFGDCPPVTILGYIGYELICAFLPAGYSGSVFTSSKLTHNLLF